MWFVLVGLMRVGSLHCFWAFCCCLVFVGLVIDLWGFGVYWFGFLWVFGGCVLLLGFFAVGLL